MKNMSCFDYEATGTNELGTEGMDQHTVASVLFTTLVDSIKSSLWLTNMQHWLHQLTSDQ